MGTKLYFFKNYLRWFSSLSLVFLFISCGNDEREKYDSLSYEDVLTSLVMENTDLQTISNSTSISIEDLIKMKYGVIAVNEEMIKYLRDLKCAYDINDESDIEDLLEKREIHIDKTVIGKPLPKDSYISNEFQNNEKFQTQLPKIGQNFYSNKIKRFIDNKYSFWGIFKNLWVYVFNSKEDYLIKYKKEFEEQLLSEDINTYVKNRINSYVFMIVSEHKVLYNIKSNYETIDADLQMEKMQLKIDEQTQKKIIEHATLDLYDFSVNIAEDTVIAFVLWAIISLIIYFACEKAKDKAVEDVIRIWKRKREGGIIKKITTNVIATFGVSLQLEDEKERIRSKWRNIQFASSLVITAMLLAWSYFYVMKPSAEIEIGLEQKMQEQTKEYFNNVDMWVLTELNKITKTL